MIGVFIVDDHKILAQSLMDYLNGKANIECVGMAHAGKEALAEIPLKKPDVILMDIGMPEMDGISCSKALLDENPNLKIIGLSTHREISLVKQLFKAGAKGYVSKHADLGEIQQAIEQVYAGKRYIGQLIREDYLSELSGAETTNASGYTFVPQLTQREQEVLELIAEEFTTDEIAEKLFISKNTVQTHRKNLIHKFAVRNSVGLVLKALELGIIS